MKQINKGDIVGRKSYEKDIIFEVKEIINVNNKKVAILKGIIERIEADSDIDDLELIDKREVKSKQKKILDKLELRMQRTRLNAISGKILHLDGDKKYSEKSYKYYKKLKINAIVKNIPEYKQPKIVYKLLESYNPDILVITRT